MDVKGLAWIGNIYQKLEAMCLEMEEAMYEDTVKYVEHQVQTVGETVKRFYSDVLQDLDPESYVDPVKVAAADLSLNPYAQCELKRKARSKKDGRETDWKFSDDSKVISGKVSAGVYRRATANRKGGFKGNLAPPLYAPIAPILETKNNVSPLAQLKRSREVTTGHFDAVPPAQFDGVSRDTTGKFSKPVVDTVLPISRASVDSPATSTSALGTEHLQTDAASTKVGSPAADSMIESASSDGLKNTGHAPASVISPDASTLLSAATTGQKQADHAFTCASGGLSSVSSETCMKGGITSGTEETIYDDTDYEEFSREEVTRAHQERLDGCSIDAAKSNVTIDPDVEIVEPYNESFLEETCVMVDGERLHALPLVKGDRKSFKKKLREAFSSRVRLTRKAYEQLAVNYSEEEPVQGSGQRSNPDCQADSSTKILPAHSSESEWELL
ncbi:OLC1v1023807C7 [Oldenlandia corymbosa var. corymbosa]|uniref:OLC1v1023807C7 n=1 Tax=Oldenlandia corymbosa var. corymbosa TaxID=529605 RepID=A0AAV1C103_OLDCO|nr:OLC1v1023807C7 [Oldenlandia corymbosa var. corymbosa]